MSRFSGNDALTKLIQDVKTEIKGANNNSSKISQKISRIIEFPDDVTQLRVKNPIYMNNTSSGYICDGTDGNKEIMCRDGNIWMRHNYNTGWLFEWIKKLHNSQNVIDSWEQLDFSLKDFNTEANSAYEYTLNSRIDFPNGVRILQMQIPLNDFVIYNNKLGNVRYVNRLDGIKWLEVKYPYSFVNGRVSIFANIENYKTRSTDNRIFRIESDPSSTEVYLKLHVIELFGSSYIREYTTTNSGWTTMTVFEGFLLLNILCIGRWK